MTGTPTLRKRSGEEAIYVRVRPVVVGVDGSASSRHAVSFAAAEAARRRAPLQLVHVREIIEPSPEAVGEMVRTAISTAGAYLQDSQVVASIVPGSAIEVLQARSAEAQLVVVGRGDPGPLAELFGSVPLGLVGGTTCPVAVIGARPTSTDDSDVVVGVRRFEVADGVLRTAFREAELREVTLQVWHLWSNPEPDRPGEIMFPVYNAAAYGRDEVERLNAVVGAVARDFPRVPFTCEVRHKSATRSLTAAADGASLLVVGVPHRGALAGLMAGSTGRSLLRHVRCPVLFVPAAPTSLLARDSGVASADVFRVRPGRRSSGAYGVAGRGVSSGGEAARRLLPAGKRADAPTGESVDRYLHIEGQVGAHQAANAEAVERSDLVGLADHGGDTQHQHAPPRIGC
jgi:nucleotide-binding universal stress UspA family protein